MRDYAIVMYVLANGEPSVVPFKANDAKHAIVKAMLMLETASRISNFPVPEYEVLERQSDDTPLQIFSSATFSVNTVH
jgi:hypothetical protein